MKEFCTLFPPPSSKNGTEMKEKINMNHKSRIRFRRKKEQETKSLNTSGKELVDFVTN